MEIETRMRFISLIDFSDTQAADLSALSARMGFGVTRQNHPDDIPKDAAAVFVCGDRTGWLEKICQIRATHGRMFVVIATRQPDHEKWLDALEAGANDYCCAPLDCRQFEWLLRRDHGGSGGRMNARVAA
jgi:DNA-binding NarL/FixJ family response regulator